MGIIERIRWWWWRRRTGAFRARVNGAWVIRRSGYAFYAVRAGHKLPQAVRLTKKLDNPEAYEVRYPDGHRSVLGPRALVWVSYTPAPAMKRGEGHD